MDNNQEKVWLPNPYRLWAEAYFAAEKAMTAVMREAVNTRSFASGLELILNSYLQNLKVYRKITDQYMENTPLASKRDVARVAELVVGLEGKVDILESQMIVQLEELGECTALLSQEITQAVKSELSSYRKDQETDKQTLSGVNDLAQRLNRVEESLQRLADITSNISTKPSTRKRKNAASSSEQPEGN